MSSFHQLNPFQSLSAETRSPSGSRHPVMVRALVLAALLLAGLSAVLASAPPAHAHDELVGTIPTADQRLDAAPAELELTFSSPLMDLGNQILVLDADGRNWAESAPVLNRETLVQPLPANMPNGEYSVRWRAVSSDGHPITGSYEFLVGADAVAGSAAPGASDGASAGASNSASAGASAEAETTEAADSTEASDDGGLPAWLVPGILGGVTGLVILAAYSIVSRRRARNGKE